MSEEKEMDTCSGEDMQIIENMICDLRRQMTEIEQSISLNDRNFMGLDTSLHLAMWNCNYEALLSEKNRLATEIHNLEHKLCTSEKV